jgi:hypothetical protein
MKQPNDSKCRMCYRAEEHVQYIVAMCPTLAPSEYTNRHNKVAAYIHRTVCKHVGLQGTDRYYGHVPERVTNVNGTTIMCEGPVFTDRTVLANRPDKPGC